METTQRTSTFKDVHSELEAESIFINQERDYKNFSEKARVLESAGFHQSIATKMYKAISEMNGTIQRYQQRYPQYKFILKPQLERVCEKYNLFVRDTGYFISDIPEPNIKDLMNFKVHLDDLKWRRMMSPAERLDYHVFAERYSIPIHLNPMTTHKDIPEIILDINLMRKAHLVQEIKIAAVKSMFDKSAFEHTQERIPGTNEVEAKGQVDLDPIVLCETRDGYLIITAWGDEANDELVINPKNN